MRNARRAALPDFLSRRLGWRGGDLLFPIRPNEDDHSCHKCNSAIDGPLDLPRHKASRQDIDPLQKPYAAEKHQHNA